MMGQTATPVALTLSLSKGEGGKSSEIVRLPAALWPG